MDVTRDDHVQHAVQYVRDNLPAGEQGKNLSPLLCFIRFRLTLDFRSGVTIVRIVR